MKFKPSYDNVQCCKEQVRMMYIPMFCEKHIVPYVRSAI